MTQFRHGFNEGGWICDRQYSAYAVYLVCIDLLLELLNHDLVIVGLSNKLCVNIHPYLNTMCRVITIRRYPAARQVVVNNHVKKTQQQRPRWRAGKLKTQVVNNDYDVRAPPTPKLPRQLLRRTGAHLRIPRSSTWINGPAYQ